MWAAGGRKENKTTEGFLILFTLWIFFSLLKVCISQSVRIPIGFTRHWKPPVPGGTGPHFLVCSNCQGLQSRGGQTNVSTTCVAICILRAGFEPCWAWGKVSEPAPVLQRWCEKLGLEAPLKGGLLSSPRGCSAGWLQPGPQNHQPPLQMEGCWRSKSILQRLVTRDTEPPPTSYNLPTAVDVERDRSACPGYVGASSFVGEFMGLLHPLRVLLRVERGEKTGNLVRACGVVWHQALDLNREIFWHWRSCWPQHSSSQLQSRRVAVNREHWMQAVITRLKVSTACSTSPEQAFFSTLGSA